MADEPSRPDSTESGSKYYRGTVSKVHRGAERGRLRSASGKDLPFIFAFLTMVGPHRRFEDLREGLEVGYDVSWTSKGLLVSVIRIPD